MTTQMHPKNRISLKLATLVPVSMEQSVLKKGAGVNIHRAGVFAKVVLIAMFLSARARIPTNVRDPAGLVENAVMMNVNFCIPTRV
jgi:hypothetical protein